jgi:hypothetical protein
MIKVINLFILDLNRPPSGPISLSHPIVTVNKYKMNLLYNGQSKGSPILNSSSVMKSVEDRIKKIENLGKKEIKECKILIKFSIEHNETGKKSLGKRK